MKTVLIGGAAGLGINKAATILAKSLADHGYYVFNYRDYPSLIRGGHNFNAISISEDPVYSHTEPDIVVALDKHTVDTYKADTVLADASDGGSLNVKKAIEELKVRPISANTYLIGACYKTLSLPWGWLEKAVKENLPKGQVEVAKRGYGEAEEKYKFEPAKAKKLEVMTGNQAIGQAALDAGLEMFIAYPMTPATPVLHYLAAHKDKLRVVQPADEITVINMALGTSYAGKMTMICTSGGGYALMSEATSLQGQSEVPLAVYMAQRTGPSTGVPTYTCQADLKFVLNTGQGEFEHVVVAPGDPVECYKRTFEALYLAYKYQVLAVVLGDKHVGESEYSFESLGNPRVKPDNCIVKPGKDYKRYKITSDGISPRIIPGSQVPALSTSYEHDEYGHTIEDAESIVKMNNKRFLKSRTLAKEVDNLEPITVHGSGDEIVVGWGSTKGAILDAIKSTGFKFLQISYIQPFPAKQVIDVLCKAKKIVLVENNATGLLGQVIREKTSIEIKEKILKYDGRPFTGQELRKKLGVEP